jgi:hypothetical protein
VVLFKLQHRQRGQGENTLTPLGRPRVLSIHAISQKHNIIFDITLCGGWAGDQYATSGCPGTCSDRVMEPSNFDSTCTSPRADPLKLTSCIRRCLEDQVGRYLPVNAPAQRHIPLYTPFSLSLVQPGRSGVTRLYTNSVLVQVLTLHTMYIHIHLIRLLASHIMEHISP